MSKRHRHFVFTLNNYKDEDETYLASLECKFIIWGYEYAPTTCTPHLQGFISFANAKSHSAVCKLLPGCHVESARKPAEAAEYCRKDGVYFEAGEPPKEDETHGHDWDLIRDRAGRGVYDDIPSDIIIRYTRNIMLLRTMRLSRECPPALDRLDNYWISGPTGCGKSRGVRDACVRDGRSYFLKEANRWWDGYDGEHTVLIEEFGPEHVNLLAGYLKLWADHYPFQAEVKCSYLKIRPQRIVVTSNFDLTTLFSMNGVLEPLQRRFQTIDMSNGDALNDC